MLVRIYSAPITTRPYSRRRVKAYLTPINHVTGLVCIICFIMGHCSHAVVPVRIYMYIINIHRYIYVYIIRPEYTRDVPEYTYKYICRSGGGRR